METKSLNEYQDFTDTTAMYDEGIKEFLRSGRMTERVNFLGLCYVTGKLNGEAGEIAEHTFKALRDDAGEITKDRFNKMVLELGDALYYIARIARHLGITLDEVAALNETKLRDRQARNQLGGSGSDR